MATYLRTDKEKAEARRFLAELDKEIWEPYRASMTFNMSGNTHEYTGHDVKRELSEEEFMLIQQKLKHFVVVPYTSNFGFNFGIAIYDHPVEGKSPTRITSFTGTHLPISLGQSFESAWQHLSPFSHSDSNKELLRRYGIEEPKEKSHYAY